jgi:hypothetical protein
MNRTLGTGFVVVAIVIVTIFAGSIEEQPLPMSTMISSLTPTPVVTPTPSSSQSLASDVKLNPCWLPSTIIQTIGTMFGIYVVIYILALPILLEQRNKFTFQKVLESKGKYLEAFIETIHALQLANIAFFILIISSSLTIISGVLWLDSLSAKLIITTPMPYLGYITLYSFLISVTCICMYSIFIILFLVYQRNPIKNWHFKRYAK